MSTGNVIDRDRDPRVKNRSCKIQRSEHVQGHEAAHQGSPNAAGSNVSDHEQDDISVAEYRLKATQQSRLETSQRLASESSQDVEYIKGFGARIVRSDPEALTQQTIHRPKPDDRSFPILAYMDNARKHNSGVLSWRKAFDAFEIVTDLGDKLQIAAADVATILYSIEQGKFVLLGKKGSVKHAGIKCIHIGDLPAMIYAFRSLLELRFFGTNVNKVDSDRITDYESLLVECHREIRAGQVAQGRERKAADLVYDPSTKAHNDALKILPGNSVIDISASTAHVQQRFLSSDGSGDDGTVKTHDLTASDDGAGIISTSQELLRSSVGEHRLCFRDGQIVEVGQLVVRLRKSHSIRGGRKFNNFDMYDGPFRVLDIPTTNISATGLFGDSDDDGARAQVRKTIGSRMRSDKSNQISQKLVKLELPANSKSQSWCSLDRLIPVYDVPSGLDNGMTTAQIFEAASRDSKPSQATPRLAQTLDSSMSHQMVFRLNEETFLTCPYVCNQGLGEDLFEVDKLRGKRIARLPAAEYPDEPQDVPELREYLRRGGKVSRGQKLVLQYLVHWSGWPSEDDTWERGHGNIPQDIINDYNEQSKVEYADKGNDKEKGVDV